MTRRFEVRRAATMWYCEADFELVGPHSAIAWEPLDVVVPPDARPYCCLGNHIHFHDAAGRELARTTYHDLHTVSATLLHLGGRWWSIGSAVVLQKDGQWHVQWGLADNTREAIQANAGVQAEKIKQLARTQ